MNRLPGFSSWGPPLGRIPGRLAPIVLGALVCGAALRLALPADLSFLGDEQWTFDHVQNTRHGDAWPELGMPSSRGVKNAPMSVWVFVVLAAIGRVTTPEGLTRAVAILAILAHVAILAIPLFLVEKDDERKPWIWAFALTMTNPILVFLERKIWAQSVLPIFDVAILCAWMRRDTRVGAFVWGFLGAIVGQIHMAGFFFVPALAGFTKLFAKDKKPAWAMWFAGSGLGAIPAIPWLLYLIRERPPPNPSPWWLRFRLEFYTYFFSDPSAMCTSYVVGDDMIATMKYPLVYGHATYLVGLAFVALAGASLAIALRVLAHIWAGRTDPKKLIFGDRSDTAIVLLATLFGMGVLMTLPSISIHRHYMLAIFPLPYVWTARAALRKPGGEKWLAALVLGGLVVSAGLLDFIHTNDGAADFGKSWAAQVRDGTTPLEAVGFRKVPK